MNVQSSPNPSVSSNLKPSREDISARAADLWKNYGSPANRDEEIWLEAERQLTAESTKLQTETATPKNVTPVQPPRVETETSGTSANTSAATRSGKSGGSSRRR